MVDLRPWRVPVAVILLVAMAARVGASLAGILGAAVAGSGLPAGLAGAGVGTGEIVSSVALAAVCWWCTAEDVRGARGLASIAFALVAVQILVSIVTAAMIVPSVAGGAGGRIVALLIQLSGLVVPIVAAAVLLRCARRGDAPDARSVPQRAVLPAAEPDDGSGEDTEASGPSYAEPASWAPDEAAGAAWTSAGEAARGGSAAGWGSGTATSWEPAAWPAAELPDGNSDDETAPGAPASNEDRAGYHPSHRSHPKQR